MNSIEEIRKARNKGDLLSALEGCSDLLSQDPENIDVLRIRPTILGLLKRYDEALTAFKEVFDSGYGRVADYYLAGELAFIARDFEMGCDCFSNVLKLGEVNHNNSYETATLFQLSFGLMELKRFDEATENLNRLEEIDPACSLPLPGSRTSTTIPQLRELLLRRARNQ